MSSAADRSSSRPNDRTTLEHEASHWLMRQDRGLSAEEDAALAAWLARDPRHAEAFDRLGGTWHRLADLREDPALQDAADHVLQRAADRRARASRRRLAWGAVCGLAAAAAVAFVFWSPWASPSGETAEPGHHQIIASALRRLTLPDGSVAELNGASRIATAFTAGERRVRLEQGEAHFIVAKDAARPFYVQAGDVTVRAVGTAFNVRLQTEHIEVLVTEGRVQVEDAVPPPPSAEAAPANTARPADHRATASVAAPHARRSALAAGQQAIIARRTALPEPIDVRNLSPAEVAEALAWQATRLVFNQAPLTEVVAAFNRHNRVQLRLGDPQLASRRLTGIFRADNLEGFLRLAQAIADVRAEPTSSTETVLWPGP